MGIEKWRAEYHPHPDHNTYLLGGIHIRQSTWSPKAGVTPIRRRPPDKEAIHGYIKRKFHCLEFRRKAQ